MKKKILVIDDEESICLLYEEEFKDEGYDVILDINMPGITGIEVLRIFKEKSPNIPVIMSTAYSHYKQDFTVWAADAYIIKSPDLTELKQKVKELLST